MDTKLDLYDVYEQNINFLIGSGASFGFLPTLKLGIKDSSGAELTFETLAKILDEEKEERLYSLLFMYYYRKCIRPGLPVETTFPLTPNREAVISDYEHFLRTLLAVLERQGGAGGRANIYTTNYDTCFEVAADRMYCNGSINFIVNDGSDGFQSRRFHTKNYNRRVIEKGIFDRGNKYLPQMNILHPHGSVYWAKDEKGVSVNYGPTPYKIEFTANEIAIIDTFGSIVEDDTKTINDLIIHPKSMLKGRIRHQEFWSRYSKIPIVNPTKWKFHETVFEEAYYQILRHLSLELEKPNSVLITFGFSFSDEHILHLIQRSLSNPSLTLYVTCFNPAECESMSQKFEGFNNVHLVTDENPIDFSSFNERIFTLDRAGVSA